MIILLLCLITQTIKFVPLLDTTRVSNKEFFVAIDIFQEKIRKYFPEDKEFKQMDSLLYELTFEKKIELKEKQKRAMKIGAITGGVVASGLWLNEYHILLKDLSEYETGSGSGDEACLGGIAYLMCLTSTSLVPLTAPCCIFGGVALGGGAGYILGKGNITKQDIQKLNSIIIQYNEEVRKRLKE